MCGFKFFDLTNAHAAAQKKSPFFLEKRSKMPHFTALICKSLIINGAGEGNRTLVSHRMEFIVDGWRKLNVRTQKVLSCSKVGIFLF